MTTEDGNYGSIILFPCDPLNPRRVDPHYAGERAAAITAGIDVALINHDDVQAGRYEDAVAAVPRESLAFYRGWMLTPHEYAELEQALYLFKSSELNTNADAYRQTHEMPGWMKNFSDVTPDTVIVEGKDVDLLIQRAQEKFLPAGGPVVLRDYSKSMKHYWDEAMYIPDVSNETHVRQVVARFLELRDDSFAGGLILRRYEKFLPGEYRSWWVDTGFVMTTAHPDTPHMPPPENWAVPYLPVGVDFLDAHFYTIDWALRDDGRWRVVELGDGQVSDFPADADITPLLIALAEHGSPNDY